MIDPETQDDAEVIVYPRVRQGEQITVVPMRTAQQRHILLASFSNQTPWWLHGIQMSPGQLEFDILELVDPSVVLEPIDYELPKEIRFTA